VHQNRLYDPTNSSYSHPLSMIPPLRPTQYDLTNSWSYPTTMISPTHHDPDLLNATFVRGSIWARKTYEHQTSFHFSSTSLAYYFLCQIYGRREYNINYKNNVVEKTRPFSKNISFNLEKCNAKYLNKLQTIVKITNLQVYYVPGYYRNKCNWLLATGSWQYLIYEVKDWTVR